MFVLSEMKDVITVKPWNFHRDLQDSLSYALNKKLANKVVHNVGLCMTLFDMMEIGDSYILPSDGAAHTPVKFRYVVFHPFIDEVLVGKIKRCTTEGVHVSMTFFDDIFIPAEYLQQESVFNDEEHLWVWKYQTEDGSHDLFMDINEEIRFRVIDEDFVDLTPVGPAPAKGSESVENAEQKKAPYSITGSISEPGLGLLSWWT